MIDSEQVRLTYQTPLHLADGRQGNGDGRVHVAAGDVAHGVDHDGHCQPERDSDAHMGDLTVAGSVHHHGSTARKHQHEGAYNFCSKL